MTAIVGMWNIPHTKLQLRKVCCVAVGFRMDPSPTGLRENGASKS
jgi:hypothetical protein